MEDVSKNAVGASSVSRSAAIRIGRKGDARMHKALQARLQNPKLTHVEALIEGGFDIPLDDLRDHVIIDGVSLGQRKNQFCRRLRSMKRNLDGEETSRNSAISDDTDDKNERFQSKTRKNKSKRLPTCNLSKKMNDSHTNVNPSGEPSHSTSRTPSIPPNYNPTKSQGTNNNNPLVAFPPFVQQIPGSSLSLADAQRAAIESIQQRAEKQSRRRSSLGTTSSAPLRRNSMNSSTSTLMNASNLTTRTTTQDGEDKRIKFDEERSTVEASMLAQHHHHQQQHQQQLSQYLSAEHPYEATLKNHLAGISPSYAAVLSGLAAAYTPSATNANSSSSGFLSQALAAASVNPTTAVHPQALSLSMMNNPISFPAYLNAIGQQQQQHIQQLEAKSQMDFNNNNNNNAIDHKINQLIQKSMPPATAEARNGREFTRVVEFNCGNSKFEKLRNENNNYTTTTTTNIRKEGGREPMKRRDSSSEALQLFARLNASNLEKRRSGQLSETKIQPAADLTSVLLSDPENSSDEEGSVGNNDSHQLSNAKKQKPVSISQTPLPEEQARSAAIRDFHANLRPPVPCIHVPNIESAIRQYQTENNEALRQAMRNAGFRSPHTSESSPTFAHFALLAIEEERRRLLNLKASFENERSEMSSGK